jgi:COMPASS component SWD3
MDPLAGLDDSSSDEDDNASQATEDDPEVPALASAAPPPPVLAHAPTTAPAAQAPPPPAGTGALRDRPKYTLRHTLRGHTSSISVAKFSPDGQFLASSCAWPAPLCIAHVLRNTCAQRTTSSSRSGTLTRASSCAI